MKDEEKRLAKELSQEIVGLLKMDVVEFLDYYEQGFGFRPKDLTAERIQNVVHGMIEAKMEVLNIIVQSL